MTKKINNIFKILWQLTLPLNKIEQENRKPLGPRTDHEERNKLKVRGINEIAYWPQRNQKEIHEIKERKRRLMKRREQ